MESKLGHLTKYGLVLFKDQKACWWVAHGNVFFYYVNLKKFYVALFSENDILFGLRLAVWHVSWCATPGKR